MDLTRLPGSGLMPVSPRLITGEPLITQARMVSRRVFKGIFGEVRRSQRTTSGLTPSTMVASAAAKRTVHKMWPAPAANAHRVIKTCVLIFRQAASGSFRSEKDASISIPVHGLQIYFSEAGS